MLRKTLFWVHLVLALAAGVIIVLMSATGAILAFEKQLIAWADPRVASVSDPTTVSMESLARQMQAIDPALASAGTVTLHADPAVPVLVSTRDKRLFLNPYTGQSLSDGETRTRAVMRWNVQLHRWLAMSGETTRPIGKGITGAANLMFIVVIVTGLFIWFPRQMRWHNFKTVLLPRWRLRGKARDWNWHHVVGIWTLVPLFLMAVTATVFSYAWAGNLLTTATGGSAAPATTPTTKALPTTSLVLSDPLMGLDRAIASAKGYAPDWKRMTFRLPTAKDAAIAVSVDRGTGAQPQHRTPLSISRFDGSILSAEPFGEMPLHRQARPIVRFLHTGELLGLWGQFFFGLACVAAVVLAWTGTALSWRRFAPRRKPVAPAAAAR